MSIHGIYRKINAIYIRVHKIYMFNVVALNMKIKENANTKSMQKIWRAREWDGGDESGK